MDKKAIAFLVGVFVIIIGIAVYAGLHKAPAPSGPVAVSTAEAPWSAQEETLKARLAAANLPALSAEGNALHIHQHLDLFIHGQRVEVPTDIGVHETFPQFIAPIHTHDTTGIIHVESPTVVTYTLGQFFDVWGVRLSSECLGGYCADATNTLQVYVNGEKYEGDFRALPLAAHQEIVITYGTKTETPTQIPTSYSFPGGY